MGKTTSFVQGLAEASDTQKQELGTIRDEGDKQYKYILYNEGTGGETGTQYQIAYYHAADGYQTNQVTCDLADSDEIGAGQLMATLTDGQYGWIQIRGQSTALAVDVIAGSVGDNLTPTGATTDGTLDVSAVAETDHQCAILLDDTASANIILCNFPR